MHRSVAIALVVAAVTWGVVMVHGQKTWWPVDSTTVTAEADDRSENGNDTAQSLEDVNQPMCHNELAAVYRATTEKGAVGSGCSYLHFDGRRGAYQFPNKNSQICADVGTNPGGHPAVTYVKATRTSYYTTGTGKYVWWINTVCGKENPFAPIPSGEDVIGLEVVGKTVYLFTLKGLFTAPITPVPSKFTDTGIIWTQQLVDLKPDSLVDVAPSTVQNTAAFYLTGSTPRGGPQLYTVRIDTKTGSFIASTSVPIQGLAQDPAKLFYADCLKQVILSDSNGALSTIDTSNGVTKPLFQTTEQVIAATVNGDFYYAANSSLALSINLKNGRLDWKSKINGAPILGDWIFLA